MSYIHTHTIVAPSTAVGGAIAVVRLSGADSLKIVGALFSRPLEVQRATYGLLRDYGGEPLDEVVVTYFQSPHSFTGEDMVEISCHGSAWIVSELVRSCVHHGARVAEPGEFSLRAMLGGKIDLSQAEAIGDLIMSNSRASAQVALGQIRGGYSEEFKKLRAELLNVLTLMELELDFGEEEVEFASRTELLELVQKIMGRVGELKRSFALGNVLKNGVAVAIVGAPNVGKSTLLNALVGEERAIVSQVAGTTRDYIEVPLTIGGVAFRFIDTAGIRTGADEIESQGIERSREQLQRAQVILHMVVDGDEAVEAIEVGESQHYLRLCNKCDGGGGVFSGDSLMISAKYGEGMEELRGWLQGVVEGGGLSATQGDIIVSNERHHEALALAFSSFERAVLAIEDGLPTDLVSAELRMALGYLGEITGEITTNDILANIFANFCIGK